MKPASSIPEPDEELRAGDEVLLLGSEDHLDSAQKLLNDDPHLARAIRLNTNTDIDDCLGLMQRLIEYRYQKALHHQLMKAADHSMLGYRRAGPDLSLRQGSRRRHSRDRFLSRRVDHRRRPGRARFGKAEEIHQHRTGRPAQGSPAGDQGHFQRPQKKPLARRIARRGHPDQRFFVRGENDHGGPRNDRRRARSASSFSMRMRMSAATSTATATGSRTVAGW